MSSHPESLRIREEIAASTNDRQRLENILLLLETAVHDGFPVHRADSDEAIRLAESIGDPPLLANTLRYAAMAVAMSDRKDRAIDMLRRGVAISESIGDEGTLGEVLYNLASVLSRSGRPAEAITALDRCEEITARLGGAPALGTLAVRCRIYYRIGDAPGLIATAHRMKDLAIEYDSDRMLFFAMNYIASAYQLLGDYQMSLRICQELLEHPALEPSNPMYISTLANIGLLHIGLGDYTTARETYVGLTSRIEESGDVTLLARVHLKLAETSYHLHDYSRTIADAGRALELARTYQTPDIEAEALTHLGLGNSALNNVAEGERSLLEALAKYEEIGESKNAADVMMSLAALYERLGRPAECLALMQRARVIHDEVRGVERQREVARFEMRRAVEQASREGELMKEKAALLEAEVQRKEAQLAAMALSLVEKGQVIKSLKSDVEEVAQQVDGSARRAMTSLARQIDGGDVHADAWRAFELQFEQVHSGFLGRLSERYPELSRTELKICALLKIGMSTKEIADVFRSSDRTIGNHRYRIRKKLGLDEDTPFHSFFASV